MSRRETVIRRSKSQQPPSDDADAVRRVVSWDEQAFSNHLNRPKIIEKPIKIAGLAGPVICDLRRNYKILEAPDLSEVSVYGLFRREDPVTEVYPQEPLLEFFDEYYSRELDPNSNQKDPCLSRVNNEQFEASRFDPVKHKVRIGRNRNSPARSPHAEQQQSQQLSISRESSFLEGNSISPLHFKSPNVTKSNGPPICVDLNDLDNFTEEAIQDIDGEIARRRNRTNFLYRRGAFLKSLVSQNRVRYKDKSLNLDLTYITARVIAMSYPGEGLKTLYRNSLKDVLKYFAKFHCLKVKVYNLCDDPQINTNRLEYKIDEHYVKKYALDRNLVPISYFPMMDHNPGPLKLSFLLCLDALAYILQDPDNMLALHCKAGKGRTGFVISQYLLFMEGSETAYEAVQKFNSRRTIDMKGLSIPSQIRYVHYFNHFLESTFQKPYRKLVVPYLRNPQIFDDLFKPKEILKLTSISLGPFLINPDFGSGTKIEIKLRSFTHSDLFSHPSCVKQRPRQGEVNPEVNAHFVQKTMYDILTEKYYILIIFTSQLIVEKDICISIKAKQVNNRMWPFSFYYWLSAPYVRQQVGKVKKIPMRQNIIEKRYLNISELINYDDETFEELINEGVLNHQQVLEMTKYRFMASKKTQVWSGILQRKKTGLGAPVKEGAHTDTMFEQMIRLADHGTESADGTSIANDVRQIQKFEEYVLHGMLSFSYRYFQFLESKGWLREHFDSIKDYEYKVKLHKEKLINQKIKELNRNIEVPKIKEEDQEYSHSSFGSPDELEHEPIEEGAVYKDIELTPRKKPFGGTNPSDAPSEDIDEDEDPNESAEVGESMAQINQSITQEGRTRKTIKEANQRRGAGPSFKESSSKDKPQPRGEDLSKKTIWFAQPRHAGGGPSMMVSSSNKKDRLQAAEADQDQSPLRKATTQRKSVFREFMEKNKDLASTFNPDLLQRSATSVHQRFEQQPQLSKTLGTMKDSEDQTVFAASQILSTRENKFNPLPVKNIAGSSDESGYSDDLPKEESKQIQLKKVQIDDEKSKRLLELNKVSIDPPSKSVERPLPPRRDSDADSLLFYPNNQMINLGANPFDLGSKNSDQPRARSEVLEDHESSAHYWQKNQTPAFLLPPPSSMQRRTAAFFGKEDEGKSESQKEELLLQQQQDSIDGFSCGQQINGPKIELLQPPDEDQPVPEQGSSSFMTAKFNSNQKIGQPSSQLQPKQEKSYFRQPLVPPLPNLSLLRDKPTLEKTIYKVSLNAHELDKFKLKRKFLNLQVVTCFYQDEEADSIMFKERK